MVGEMVVLEMLGDILLLLHHQSTGAHLQVTLTLLQRALTLLQRALTLHQLGLLPVEHLLHLQISPLLQQIMDKDLEFLKLALMLPLLLKTNFGVGGIKLDVKSK